MEDTKNGSGSPEQPLVVKHPREVLDPNTIYAIQTLVLGGYSIDVHIEFLEDGSQIEVYVGGGAMDVALVERGGGRVGIEQHDPNVHETPPIHIRFDFVIEADSPAEAFERYDDHALVASKAAAEQHVQRLIESVKEAQEKERNRIVTSGEMPPPPPGLRKV